MYVTHLRHRKPEMQNRRRKFGVHLYKTYLHLRFSKRVTKVLLQFYWNGSAVQTRSFMSAHSSAGQLRVDRIILLWTNHSIGLVLPVFLIYSSKSDCEVQ